METRRSNQNVYPKKFLLVKETIGNFKLIAEIFNNFFTKSRPKIATEIETPAKSFGLYLK